MALRKELEQEESHLGFTRKVAQYWKACWHQVAVALKPKEEELQTLQRQKEAWLPRMGALCPPSSHSPHPISFPTALSFLLQAS